MRVRCPRPPRSGQRVRVRNRVGVGVGVRVGVLMPTNDLAQVGEQLVEAVVRHLLIRVRAGARVRARVRVRIRARVRVGVGVGVRVRVRALLIGLRHRRRGARRGAPPLGALV